MFFKGTAGPCPTPCGNFVAAPFSFFFFHASFGTVQKSLFQALGAILVYFLFDLKSFVGALASLWALLFAYF